MIIDAYICILGQAFVILKTREAAERVIRKLRDGCLILPNQRYGQVSELLLRWC